MANSKFCKFVLICLFFSGAHAVLGQTSPTAEQMIEQLKAPKTRGLRNLTVEPVPGKPALEAETVPAKPSLSLQIQFDFNSARVRPESHQALANLSQAMLSPELAKSRFAVEGHTDAKGGAEFNRKLSEQRALAVRELLRIQGVSETRMLASGKGFAELVNPGDPLAAENRRVRIVNLD